MISDQAVTAALPPAIAWRTGSISSSSSMSASWNSSMPTAASSLWRSASRPRLSAAAASAASKRRRSSAGSFVELAPTGRRSASLIWPSARPGEATLPSNIRSGWFVLIEIALDQSHQGIHGRVRVGAGGTEEDRRALAQLQTHHPDDALGIDPALHAVAAQMDRRGEALGELGQLHRRPGVEPDLMGDYGGAFDRAFGTHDLPLIQGGDNSSAVARTCSRLPPPADSVAAMTAPSTMGALQITILSRHASGNISMAISLLVSAPPRSTSTATPLLDHTFLIAAMIEATSVPRPPAGFPPLPATGTSWPTIWRTMSTVPLATSAECETMTIPTRLVMRLGLLPRPLNPTARRRRHGPEAGSIGLPGRDGRSTSRPETTLGPWSP